MSLVAATAFQITYLSHCDIDDDQRDQDHQAIGRRITVSASGHLEPRKNIDLHEVENKGEENGEEED